MVDDAVGDALATTGVGSVLRATLSRVLQRRKTSAILLAAGESSRMGRPKALLPWAGGTTLIDYQVRELVAAGVQDVVVVLGHDAPRLMKVLFDDVRPRVDAEVRAAVNAEYEEGRASSLRSGATALGDHADPIVILGVDQPRPSELTRTLLEAHSAREATITAPAFEGHRGHPIVVANALLPELRRATESTEGLRGILESHEDEVLEVAVDSAQARLDLNTPEEYEAAFSRYGST